MKKSRASYGQVGIYSTICFEPLKTALGGSSKRTFTKMWRNNLGESEMRNMEKYRAILTLTFTVSAPIRHMPVFSYRFTPHSRGHKLQFLRCAYAVDLFLDVSTADKRWYLGM